MSRLLPLSALLALSVCLRPAAASAQDAEGDAPAFSFLKHSGASVRSEFTARYFGYARSDQQRDDNNYGEADLRTTFTGRLGDRLNYTAIPQFRFDSSDHSAPEAEFREENPQRPRFTAAEAYLAYYGDTYEFTAGKRIYSWGVGDGLKPTDNLNPSDYTDMPTTEKIGIPAVSMYRYGRLVNLEAVWAPLFTPSRLADSSSRWSAANDGGLDRYRAAFGSDPILVDGGRDLPGDDLESSQAGIRLSSSLLVEGWDLGLVLNHGHFPIGVIRSMVAPPYLTVVTEYPRYQEYGFTASTTIGDWEWHGEASFHVTENEEMADDYIEYVGGFNYTFDDIFVDTLEEIRVILEYCGEEVTRERPEDSDYSDAGFGRSLVNSLLSRLTFKFSEETEIELGGAVNFDDGDYSVQGSVSHAWRDWITIKGGVDVLEGPSDTFFGGWDDNDRAFVVATLYL